MWAKSVHLGEGCQWVKWRGSKCAHQAQTPGSDIALVQRSDQPTVDARRPRWTPRSVSPKGRSEEPNLKRTVVSDRMRGMTQTCSMEGLLEGRKTPSKNGGQIAPKESADEELRWPKMMGQKNDSWSFKVSDSEKTSTDILQFCKIKML